MSDEIKTTGTPPHPGACDGCDTLEICVEQDECWVDHRSLFRMAEHLATKTTTIHETITVSVYWPGEGAGGIPDRVETMEHAHAAARRMAAMGYGAKSKATKRNEIHIVRTVREVTVWSESDGE